jgi:hypothetical protein
MAVRFSIHINIEFSMKFLSKVSVPNSVEIENCGLSDIATSEFLHFVQFVQRMDSGAQGVFFCFSEQVALVVSSVRKVFASNLAQICEAKSPRVNPGIVPQSIPDTHSLIITN